MSRKRPELTRIREHGTEVTNTAQAEDPGLARIAALQRIVAEKQYAKVDGQMIDLTTASLICQVYDAISDENKAQYRAMPVTKMASIAYKLAK